ncbi:MAG: ZIP family metal transporter [Anaeroplasmataceae bacterium]|nr:ZIP family metal transporter [Anaeroplasmataceae bacterium]
MHILILGFIIPLLGTTIGSLFVFLIKKEIHPSLKNLLQGFAAGVMLAASIWSLIIPAIDLSGDNPYTCYIPAAIGFILGMLALMLFDIYMSKRKKVSVNMLNLAVVIHNIPEGLSVGVAFAAAMRGDAFLATTALALSFGIGVQNIPEGSIISLNLVPEHSKLKAFWKGFLSGVVEPIASVIAYLLMMYIEPTMPYLLSFAAGAMIFVVVDELIPSSHSHICNVGICIGFVIMMVLDVMLG